MPRRLAASRPSACRRTARSPRSARRRAARRCRSPPARASVILRHLLRRARLGGGASPSLPGRAMRGRPRPRPTGGPAAHRLGDRRRGLVQLEVGHRVCDSWPRRPRSRRRPAPGRFEAVPGMPRPPRAASTWSSARCARPRRRDRRSPRRAARASCSARRWPGRARARDRRWARGSRTSVSSMLRSIERLASSCEAGLCRIRSRASSGEHAPLAVDHADVRGIEALDAAGHEMRDRPNLPARRGCRPERSRTTTEALGSRCSSANTLSGGSARCTRADCTASRLWIVRASSRSSARR